MYIIFGISEKNKDLAYSNYPVTCSHCNATQNWVLKKRQPYLTLFFFLKMFPMGPADYNYVCPSCNYGVGINPSNVNNVLNDVAMTNDLAKELNSETFVKYMDKMAKQFGGQPMMNQMPMNQPQQVPAMPMNQPVNSVDAGQMVNNNQMMQPVVNEQPVMNQAPMNNVEPIQNNIDPNNGMMQ